ncbi:MAG: hypothetical protein V3W44_09540 [Dehalococcoidales bacterium]
MKPTLALMAYGGVMPQTVASVCASMLFGVPNGIKWQLFVGGDDAAIDRARSKAAGIFLANPGSECLVMIDHDMTWQTGDLIHLAEECVSRQAIVGAVCSKRAFGQGYGGRFPETDVPVEIGSSALIPLPEDYYVGGAVLAIPRAALEALVDTLPLVRGGDWPFFMPMVKRHKELGIDEYLSEDWAFVHRCREAGFDCLATMKPIITHYGEYGFTIFDS